MTKANFIQADEFDQLLNAEKPLVIDYTATWCGPCRLVAPLIDQLAGEYQDRANVVKVDIDQNRDHAKQFGIKSIPAVLIFKGGEVVETLVGKASYETFSQALEKHI